MAWQKIVAWLSAASFSMLITWGTWVTISLTGDMSAAADYGRRVTVLERSVGSLSELRADIRVLSTELQGFREQLKDRCDNP